MTDKPREYTPHDAADEMRSLSPQLRARLIAEGQGKVIDARGRLASRTGKA